MLECLKNLLNGACNDKKQRALVIVGAGASVEYGIPATEKFNGLIDAGIAGDTYCSSVGGHDAYLDVKKTLESYYGNPSEAHFERIYHVMHELYAFEKTPGAVPKYSAVMQPFLKQKKEYSSKALKVACQSMLKIIYKEVSSACEKPIVSLQSLESFFSSLEKKFIPRVYTTNYDDFISQATQDQYFTGFDLPSDNHQIFNSKSYWSNWNKPGLFHLHGSVHFGFPAPQTHIELAWYNSRTEAIKNSEFNGSIISTMDGTGVERSAIITGLNKLDRLQQTPFATYYSGLSRDVIEADIVIILGSGLADLHLNTWFREIRKHSSHQTPLLYVGYWGGNAEDFCSSIRFEQDELQIALFHDLGFDLNIPEAQFRAIDGWTIDANNTGAVWADGFQSFLSKGDGLNQIIDRLMYSNKTNPREPSK